MALVERLVQRARGIEVGGQSILVAALERMAEQRRAVAAAPLCEIDADERQVPVRFGEVELAHLLQKPKTSSWSAVGWLRPRGRPSPLRPARRRAGATAPRRRSRRSSPRCPCERGPGERLQELWPVREIAIGVGKKPTRTGSLLKAIVIVAIARSSSAAGETLICSWVATVNSNRGVGTQSGRTDPYRPPPG